VHVVGALNAIFYFDGMEDIVCGAMQVLKEEELYVVCQLVGCVGDFTLAIAREA
jgi:hypothetical protein